MTISHLNREAFFSEERAKNKSTAHNTENPTSFHIGIDTEAYKYLGVHRKDKGNIFEYSFRAFAPNAEKVSLVSDFTDWIVGKPMSRITDGGIWEVIFVTSEKLEGKKYKFLITSGGKSFYKRDPFAFASERAPKNASVIYTERHFRFNDSAWLEKRRKISAEKSFYPAPLNIYEVSLSSWRIRCDRAFYEEKYYNYRELANMLLPYLKRFGYTHILLMPITEYFEEGGEYSPCGYFSPTQRFGSPDDFGYFVNKLHTNGVGVLIDWVPSRFSKEESSLYSFDGTALFEKKNAGQESEAIFDFSKREVVNFLLSSAEYWLSEFHIDGFRVNSVSSMLYLDYRKASGEWTPNEYGTNDSPEAVGFLRLLNTEMFAKHPDIIMIADEHSEWPKVTATVKSGGLGFNFKADNTQLDGMYEYISQGDLEKKELCKKAFYPLSYSLSENYINSLSHELFSVGNISLFEKAFGTEEEKLRAVRLFSAYRIFHPAKKLTFMGCEFAQPAPWNPWGELMWSALNSYHHRAFADYTASLNCFYLSHPALWERDFSKDGFERLIPLGEEENLIILSRKSGKDELIGIFNFSTELSRELSVKVKGKKYRAVFASDERYIAKECGEENTKSEIIKSRNGKITVSLYTLSAIFLERLE